MLYDKFTSYNNLFLAYRRARKHKTLKSYVIEFEKDLKNNLLLLQSELKLKTYRPRPLETFIIRDPKTRKISKSDFRDRVIHHALCNIIEPIFEKTFIYDSYANRIGKGSLNAVKRFECFKRKVSKNNTKEFFVLKADIRKYFENVDHNILLAIISRRINDVDILWIISVILGNHQTDSKGKGMPLGNLTSQFFANVYLNELDQYIKHEFKIEYYLRYVEDFVIMSTSYNQIEYYKRRINLLLETHLGLELHPEKTKIVSINRGTCFLGIRIFSHHRLLKKSNIHKFKNKIEQLCEKYYKKEADYDQIYNIVEGWTAYSRIANSYALRKKILNPLEQKYAGEISTKEYNRYLKR